MSAILVQIHERRLSVNLTKGDRTTVLDLVHELSRTQLSDELRSGKVVKLIFSGRILSASELISNVVPQGGVLHCAITNRTTEETDVEEGVSREENTQVPSLTRRRQRDEHLVDFLCGLALGYGIGPIMCFWVLEPGSMLFKLGILLGCFMKSYMIEYRELEDIAIKNAVEESEETKPMNSFDIVTV